MRQARGARLATRGRRGHTAHAVAYGLVNGAQKVVPSFVCAVDNSRIYIHAVRVATNN